MEITHNADGSIEYELDGRLLRIYPDEHFTEHFTLREMLRSNYAEQRGILNLPREEANVNALRRLCERVLEPLRQQLGRKVVISSGYRTPCLNFCVGGAKNSQHTLGEAADIYCVSEKDAREVFDIIKQSLPYDQLILENHKKSDVWWVHVSYTERRDNREWAFSKTV